MSSALLNSNAVKAQAKRLGFVACGLAPAAPVAEPFAAHLRQWLSLDYCADMDYMRRNVDKRLDPRLLMPGVRTIVSLAMNFMPARFQPAISLYAQGKDYHDVLRERMFRLMADMGLEGRAFVDTAPVLERYWAWRSGVGVIDGPGGFISVPDCGPTVFLGELFLTEEADKYDSPLPAPHGPTGPTPNPSLAGRGADTTRELNIPLSSTEGQGENSGVSEIVNRKSSNCKLCCSALTPEGLDARRCISYQTIEHRGPLPDGFRLHQTFYGCDRCLRATPGFAEAKPTEEPDFQPSDDLLRMSCDDWSSLTVEQYRSLFKGSAVKRAKYEGLMRNIARWLRK